MSRLFASSRAAPAPATDRARLGGVFSTNLAPMKAWGPLVVALAVALVAAPANAIAKPGYFVSGQGRRAVLSTHGSNGFRVRIEARAPRRQRLSQIYVTASKGPATVQYSVRGSLASDDSIDVHLPHVGRIAVDFVPAHVTRRRRPDNCEGSPSRVEHGYFRGYISLRGEREFTVVERSSARGRVVQTYRSVCDNQGSSAGNHKGPKFSSEIIFTGAKKGRSRPGFMAYQAEFGQTLVGPSFSARTAHFREGMSVFTGVDVEGGRGDLTAPELGDPKVVEVQPPAPFEGSATFRLTGAKTSTWEGDLAVELPGLGKESLAGPDFWSAYCQEQKCTDTLPANVVVAIAGVAG